MATLQRPVASPVVRAKQSGLSVPVNSPFVKTKLVRSGFLGIRGLGHSRGDAGYQQRSRKCGTTQCSFSSSSNGNHMAGNSSENDADYVNSSVLEADEVQSGSDGFMIKMRDGRQLKCVHNNPLGGHLPDYAPHPAIVLKIENETGLLLPIIVCMYMILYLYFLIDFKLVYLLSPFPHSSGTYWTVELPSVLLMAAVCNVQIVRPTMYNVVKDMIEKMGFTVKLVRVTKRVHEAYFAELHLVKLGNEAECISFDMRPSDAINIAVRCKVPIQVNKFLAFSDGVRVVNSAKVAMQSLTKYGPLLTELDRPSGQPCLETKEFNLVRNMMVAAIEERYRDAAQWRDRLTRLRSKRNWT